MIQDKDRAFWFGASDTSYIVGNLETASFKKWWLEKMGLRKNELSTKAMKCGNAFEHKILDTIPGIRKDHQIIIPELRLRVNYDGDVSPIIYEVKTHKESKPFKVSAAYWRQAQVEMFAYKTKQLYIVAYALSESDYQNYFNDIEPERITRHKVEYDEKWIEEKYLPRLRYLCECLEKGVLPKNEQKA